MVLPMGMLIENTHDFPELGSRQANDIAPHRVGESLTAERRLLSTELVVISRIWRKLVEVGVAYYNGGNLLEYALGVMR